MRRVAIHYAGRHWCEQGRRVGAFGRVVRVPLDTDRRFFTPMARHTYKWLDAYKHRTAVERVFSRIDGVFGFEHHSIRGFAKMDARITPALLVNVCMALARVNQGQVERLR